MAPKLLLEPSLRVCKYIFSFLEMQNGDLVCRFWTLPFVDILARSDLCYLSQANVETPFDAWCADIGVGGGNKVAERKNLIQLTGENEDSSIAAIKVFAGFELMVTE